MHVTRNEELVNLCKCGRLKEKFHCAKCGSGNTIALTKTNRRYSNSVDNVKEFRVYRCRKCGELFDELDIENCQAPIRVPTKAEINDDIMKKELEYRVANFGKLDENDKRMFKRLHGMSVDDWQASIRALKARGERPQSEAQKLEAQRQQEAIKLCSEHHINCQNFMTDNQCDICDKLQEDCKKREV